MLRHTLTRGAFAAATAIALTVGGGLTPLAGTATAEEPAPGEVVVPAAPKPSPTPGSPYLPAQSRYARADAAGTEGVFHQGANQQLFWTRYADGSTTPVTRPDGTGTTVVGTGTSSLAFLRAGEVELRDIDGTSRRMKLPEGLRASAVFDSTVVAYAEILQPDGTTTIGSWHLLSLNPDGTVRDLPVTGPDADTFMGGSAAGDRSGILTTTRVQDETRRYGFASTETGHVGTLTPPVPKSFTRAKLSPDRVALYSSDSTNHKVLVASRSDLSAAPTEVTVDNYQASGTSNDQFAIVGDWLVYVSSHSSLDAVPIAGGPAITLLPKAYVVSTPSDGTAAVIGGSDALDWGVRHVTADASGKPVVTMVKPLPNPAKIRGIALAQGRLSVVDDSIPNAFEHVRDISLSGALTYGSRSKLSDIPMDLCREDDSACAAYMALGDGRFIRRVDTDDTNWRYYINGSGNYDFSDLSLPAGGRIDALSSRYLVHTVPSTSTTPGTQTIRSISGGILETRAPVAAALWNTSLWSATGVNGALAAKDLKTGKAVETVNTGAPCVPAELQATDRWLYWSCGANGPAGVYDRTAKSSRSVPSGEALLGDGYVVTHDKAAGKLVLTGAAADGPASRVVGALPDTGVSQRHVRWSVDKFGGHLAYVDAEQQVHVVATGIPAQPLAVLDGTAGTYVDAASTGKWQLLTRRYSKPVGSWTLTARHDRTGQVSDLAVGVDARGKLEIFWNGRDKAGTLLANGAYTWTLTAPPADGIGPAVQESGTVTLVGGASLASSRFVGVSGTTNHPVRILDTRSGLGARKGKVGPGGSITLQVTGQGQVPATDVTSVALNVTAVNPSASTYVTVHPYGTTRPNASNLNVPAGRIVAGMVVVPVKDGKVTLYNHAGSVDLVADVTGYYTTGQGSLFEPLKPARIVDSRIGLGVAKGRLEAGMLGWAPVLGRGGVPNTGVTAVVLQLTATNPSAATFVSAYGTPYADTYVQSHVQVAAGQTASNLVVVPLYDDSLALLNRFGAADVIADVVGYYRNDDLGSLFQPLAPSRSLDTRAAIGAPKAKLGGGRTLTLTVAGRNGVPATGATAVVMNVTATNASSGTYVSVYPYGTTRPNTSNLNVAAGQTVSNLVVVPVVDGKVTLYNNAGTVDLVADVQGFYAP
ncbi:hypothetical protein [Streptomyces sp. SKN60]|uniref:hypothetical protein n=1 Tax=Streptomyces sp. SKN60 TaxID=2855506 RepID=UPI002245495E|nr:hypothetical protein [Streptomyces sp. SKN60]